MSIFSRFHVRPELAQPSFARALFATSLLVLASCADVSAVRVADFNRPVSGIPFYAQMPIVAVKNGTMSIEFIPNPSEKYALKVRAFFAKNHTAIEFNGNGSIKSLNANLDSSAALETLLDFAEKIITEKPFTSGGGAAATENISVIGGQNALYAFKFAPSGVPVGLIKLRVLPDGASSHHHEIEREKLQVIETTPQTRTSTQRNGSGQSGTRGSTQPVS